MDYGLVRLTQELLNQSQFVGMQHSAVFTTCYCPFIMLSVWLDHVSCPVGIIMYLVYLYNHMIIYVVLNMYIPINVNDLRWIPRLSVLAAPQSSAIQRCNPP